MDSRDAARLIAPAVRVGESWADLGAGTGTFTVALAQLVGPTATVFAVEREISAIRALDVLAGENDPNRGHIAVRRADFTEHVELPPLDGVLLANALHFVAADEQAQVLQRITRLIVNAGAIVVVEYDNRAPSRWVPFPIPLVQLAALARVAQLGAPQQIGRRRSMFGGTMYAARLTRLDP
ncbi:MAG TPA: class I SAM-dependent methyltransferase [Gemmatimonadaceae bacterium]|nr:class I SAM-dependent methyltransferase [Gemmatimonadaceae bacterium]